MSYGNVYAPEAFTVVRNGGTASQKRSPFGLSRGGVAVVSPSQEGDARRSVVMPPNSRYFAPRALAVNSTPSYLVLFTDEAVTRVSVATPTFPEFNVYIGIACPDSGNRGSDGVLML